jgi:hypothetical protein
LIEAVGVSGLSVNAFGPSGVSTVMATERSNVSSLLA